MLLANGIFSQDAGITNVSENLIIHETNRNSFFQEGDWDDMIVKGWYNDGKVRQLITYYKAASHSSFSYKVVPNVNNGSWDREIRVAGGKYQVYLNTKCNYVGCLQIGTNSPTITFTYVRPIQANHMHIPPTNDEHITIKRLIDYGSPGLNTGFYFRTYRNTKPELAGGSYVGNYNQDEYFTDTTSERGKTYYYWTEVAMDANGSYKSGLLADGYREVTVATLGIEKNELEKSITIVTNPVVDVVSISTNNSIQLKKIIIFDINGRLLKRIEGSFETISIKEFSKGLYLLKIETDKGIVSKKIIKK